MAKTGEDRRVYATAYKPGDREEKVAGKRTIKTFAVGDTLDSEQDVRDANSGAQVREQNDMRAKLAGAQGWLKATGTGRSHPDDASEV